MEVGGRKSEVGSWKSEVGRPSSAFVGYRLAGVSGVSGENGKDGSEKGRELSSPLAP